MTRKKARACPMCMEDPCACGSMDAAQADHAMRAARRQERKAYNEMCLSRHWHRRYARLLREVDGASHVAIKNMADAKFRWGTFSRMGHARRRDAARMRRLALVGGGMFAAFWGDA